LRNPAAAVDVEEERLRLGGESRSLGEALGIGAVDLDRGEVLLFVPEADLALRIATAAEEALDVHELGHAELAADGAAEPAEHEVRHVLHGRKNDGLLRVELAQEC